MGTLFGFRYSTFVKAVNKLVFSFQLSVISQRLSAVSHQLSDICCQLLAFVPDLPYVPCLPKYNGDYGIHGEPERYHYFLSLIFGLIQNSKLKTQNFVLTLALITVFLALPQTAQAATYAFSPANQTFTAGCTYTIDVMVDASGQESNAADIIISYNPAIITVQDSNPDVTGIQVGEGNAYQGYLVNQVNAGTIRVAGGSYTAVLNSNQKFISITFSTAPSATSAQFNITYNGVGQTYDSNIADRTTSNDLLTGVTNGSYTFSAGQCASADLIAPVISFTTPSPNNPSLAASANVVFTLSDTGSGINTGSLVAVLNNEIYRSTDPEVSIVPNGSIYTVTIDPRQPIPQNSVSVLNVEISDNNNNTAYRQLVINPTAGTVTPPPDDEEPGEEEPTPGEEEPGEEVPTGEECECDTEPEVEIQEVIVNRDILKNTVLENTVVERVVQTVGISGFGALLGSIAVGLNVLPLLTLLNAPGLLVNFVAVILGRKQKKPWGIIVSAQDLKPIPFATCRLYRSGTTNVIQQTVSDIEGRYGFVITPGEYRLEVSRDGYAKFSKEINIAEGEAGYVYDVKLHSQDLADEYVQRNNIIEALKAPFRWIKQLYQSLKPALFVLGFMLALLSSIFVPNVLNYVIFGIYIVFLGVFAAQKLSIRQKSAAIVDSASNLRIPFATIKIFDPRSLVLIDTQSTNQQGYFDYWGEPGEYLVLVATRGYKFPSIMQTDYQKVEKGLQVMLLVNLTKGYNQIKLYVDPITGTTADANTAQADGGNLATPFG